MWALIEERARVAARTFATKIDVIVAVEIHAIAPVRQTVGRKAATRIGAPVLAPHAVLGPRVDVTINIENGHDYKVEWHLLEDRLLDEVQRRRHGDPFARVSARINPDKSRIIRII